MLSANNVSRRLAWAKQHRRDKFTNVLFSDECTIFVESDVRFVWKKRGEVMRRPRSGHSAKVNIYGCMAQSGFGQCHVFEENMTGASYLHILEHVTVPSAQNLLPHRWRLQDDNCPAHRSRLVTEWKERHNITSLPWPSQSPDMNVIENVWATLRKRVHNRMPRNKTQLIEFIRDEWSRLTPAYAKELVSSMPNRIQAVIEAGGRNTIY